MSWREEFKASYDVPEAPLLALGFEDTSWHNDAAPSFMRSWDGNYDHGFLRIWTDHPDPQERDCDTQEGERFGLDVAIDDHEGQTALCTNDLELILRVIRIVDFCLANRNDELLLGKVANEFTKECLKAFVEHTGGGIMVAELQLTPTEAIGVSDDAVVLWRREQHILAVLQGAAAPEASDTPAAAPTVREALQALVNAHDEQPSMLTEVEWRNAREALRAGGDR